MFVSSKHFYQSLVTLLVYLIRSLARTKEKQIKFTTKTNKIIVSYLDENIYTLYFFALGLNSFQRDAGTVRRYTSFESKKQTFLYNYLLDKSLSHFYSLMTVAINTLLKWQELIHA